MVAEASPRSRLRAATVALWPLAFVAICGALQLSMRSPWDGDTGYHVAVARLMREHGVLHEFPWTRFSWLADHYADKEFLFHVALVPFASLPWITAARIVGTLFGALLLSTLWGILRAEKVRYAGLWTLAALLSSSSFAFRTGLVRPHVFAVTLALVVVWSAARRRLPLLAVATILYPLSYTAFHTALFLVLIVEAASFVAGRGFEWKPILTTVAGLALGIALHPNTLNLLRLFWIVNVEILGGAWRRGVLFDFGTEFEPFEVSQLPLQLGIPAAFAVGGAVLAWRRRREDPLPLSFCVAALAWIAMTLQTKRFIEYAAPFSAAAMALSWRWMPRPRVAATAAACALAVVLVFSGPALAQGLRARGGYFPESAAETLRALVPPNATVFTCDWSLTGEAMAALPDRRLMIALDPFLFYRRDPERYKLWRAILATPPPRPAFFVRQFFDSRYVLCAVDATAFSQALRADPEARVLAQSVLWTLFEILPPGG